MVVVYAGPQNESRKILKMKCHCASRKLTFNLKVCWLYILDPCHYRCNIFLINDNTMEKKYFDNI